MKHYTAAELNARRERREELRVVVASCLSVLAAIAVLVFLFLVMR